MNHASLFSYARHSYKLLNYKLLVFSRKAELSIINRKQSFSSIAIHPHAGTIAPAY
jgi:hypothetical protein